MLITSVDATSSIDKLNDALWALPRQEGDIGWRKLADIRFLLD